MFLSEILKQLHGLSSQKLIYSASRILYLASTIFVHNSSDFTPCICFILQICFHICHQIYSTNSRFLLPVFDYSAGRILILLSDILKTPRVLLPVFIYSAYTILYLSSKLFKQLHGFYSRLWFTLQVGSYICPKK